MYDLKIIKRAKLYVDAMSLGINPLNGEYVEENDSLAQKRIQDCMVYVSEMLADLIANDGKTPRRCEGEAFAVMPGLQEKFEFSEDPIGVNEIAKRINAVLGSESGRTVSGAKIASWVAASGYLDIVAVDDRKTKKVLNERSEAFGISETEAHNMTTGETYTKLLYNQDAQKNILEHIEDIVKGS